VVVSFVHFLGAHLTVLMLYEVNVAARYERGKILKKA
jgi:hypothetical protein